MITQQELLFALERIAAPSVLVVGDAMLDHYLLGQVNRISPEAPVPILQTTQEFHRLGGAANVADNIVALNGRATLVSVTGLDERGQILQDLLAKHAIASVPIYDPKRPTTTKTRIIAHNQQMLRIDHESSAPLDASLSAALQDQVLTKAVGQGALVFSDYAKGVLSTPHTRQLVQTLHESRPQLPLLVDAKPHNFALFQGTYLVSPNALEAAQASDTPLSTEQDAVCTMGRRLLDRFAFQNVLITLGAKGMVLFSQDAPAFHLPATAQAVYDVTGAGDTVIATLAVCVAAGLPLLLSCVLANFAAGLVVGQLGTASVSVEQLKHVVMQSGTPQITKWECAP